MSGGEEDQLRASAAVEVEHLAHLLSRAEFQLTRELSRVLADGGSAVESWRVLRLLADGVSHPMSEIAEFALLPAPTLTRVIDRMVAENLAYRKADPRDRRRVLIHITARGRVKHEELGRRVAAVMQADADAAETAQLTALLGRLVNRLR
jgi:DNA-binding MarR family transcriptional regulator